MYKSITSSQLQASFRYFRSHDFLRSLAMTLLMVSSGYLLSIIGLNQWIAGTCIGILLLNFNDIQGSFTYRLKAMIFNSFLNAIIVIVINVLQFSLPLVLVSIAVISFTLYLLAVFGKRGEVFAFSASLGVVLSLVRQYQGVDLIYYAIAVLSGGLLYTIISCIYHLLTRKRQINEQLGELAKLTSDYLEHRILLAKQSNFKEEVNQKLLDLQVAIIEKQEKIGTLILSDSKINHHNSSRNRQMFLLKGLIDIMELAVANPSNLAKIKSLPDVTSQTFESFLELAEQIAQRLVGFAQELRSFKINTIDSKPIEYFKTEDTIQNYLNEIGLPRAREGVLLMTNLLDYYKLQINRLVAIETMIGTPNSHNELALSHFQQTQFLKNEVYSLKQLRANLTIKSPVFRQAARMSMALVMGYLVGYVLNVEKVYWIMLTILLVLRFSYGITLKRAKMRVLGTSIGALLALLLVQFSTSIPYFVLLAVLGMVFSFSLLERNYMLASLAITICVVFAFGLIDPNVYSVIQFRFIDTLIGSLVSILVAYSIFPFWEVYSLKKNIFKALTANQLFLQNILVSNQNDTQYRLKRKSAFLNSSILNANFQRYKQDPHHKQKKSNVPYDLVTLNHTLVATVTNLGNYLKERSIPKIEMLLVDISVDLDNNFKSILASIDHQENTQPYLKLQQYWERLETKRNKEYNAGQIIIEPEFKQELQDVQMIQNEIERIKMLLRSIRNIITTSF